jgi:hypothetical protein
MSRFDWIGANALAGGILGGVSAVLAAIGPLGLIVVGGAGVALSVVDFVNTVQIILYETGLTWCTALRLLIDVVVFGLGTAAVVKGVQAWQASGRAIGWASSRAEATRIAEQGSRIKSFVGVEGETASGLRSRIPSNWASEFEYYSPPSDPTQRIPQYRFTSPDGLAQVRAHGPQAPWGTSWVVRIGERVPAGTPGALENPFNPGEYWLYYSNEGLPTASLDAMHIKVNVSLADMIRVFGIGH